MMSHMQGQLQSQALIGQILSASSGEQFTVKSMDDFEYTDPIDKSVTKNQVLLCLHPEDFFSVFSN